ncbi:MAG: hydrogenase expression/formation protein HypE [Rhizobiales bacterium]|nr:hydrogenase expression/formation protein HypE [Hyphomicrobiales bacterium]MBO6698199.1 hydrogenase expression/formation protein HypE [Hyphomicrobiales bacterium]MBO6735547.1 hydrogenase expression/formation protein HypE [Hyphomicrobiales bacterium]MBO6910645.1 hydrogenase expression/formation protein HypE [Hyphomicrobiales bacterium]MBO6956074.1 hydrogenase expression/formation protein HypE [Hyphomicrobiales bacterium]
MNQMNQPQFTVPLNRRKGTIEMNHGAGGRAMVQLIQELFQTHLSSPELLAGNDGASLAMPAGRMVMACDAHVVSPLIFPGGDIGALSVHGTINDVAMMGAKPLYLSAAFILEEGFPLADLETIVASMGRAAREAGVPIVTGDTKVVERGKGDGVFITTTGVGVVPDGINPSGDKAHPGDAVIVSGTIGDHGIAILSKRENLDFETEIRSDSAALHTMVSDIIATGAELHVMRDPTRGGVATTLNEIAQQSAVGIQIREADIPVKPEVAAACELLGIDPLTIANEGKMLVLCPAVGADKVLTAMRAHPLGQDAAIIGSVSDDPHHFVQMETTFGGSRMIDWLTGEQLPRIC